MIAYLLRHWQMIDAIAAEYPEFLLPEYRCCIHDFFGE